MRLVLSTVCLKGTLRDKLEAAAAARFDAVELCASDFIGFRGTAREVRRIVNDLGIGIDLYQPRRDAGGAAEAPVQQTLDRAERTFDLMVQLGVSLLSVTPATLPLAWQQPALAAEHLQRLAAMAAQRNLRLAFAPEPDHPAIRSIHEAWATVDRATHPHLGLLIDSFPMLSSAEDPRAIREIPGNRIFFVRVDDARRAGGGRWAGWVRNFPGQGELPVAGLLEHVLFTGYAGPISLSSVSDVLQVTPSRRTGIDARRSLLFLESQLRDRLEHAGTDPTGPAAADRILGTVSLFDPPKPSPFHGFAFLEVGVRDDAGVRLGERLQQLGFTRYGRHRTKAVTLYRQGGIRVAVNESHPLGRFALQPAYVSSLGLLAEHAGRAASRAGALLSARQDTPRGAQEFEMPTILAPGGTMVQFLPHDQPAEADFIEDPGGTVPSCGLDVVDHVAMALTPDQRDTWLLFARAVLGLNRCESGDGPEPFGVSLGVGLANNDRSVRLLLNATIAPSSGPRTAPDAAKPGGGVDGIAFGCTDIFTTVERLRDNGVSFVPISGNYYDDLAGRTTLDDAVIERMRELQILFDSSSAGTYFHAYTEAFEDRFHFQIVQRTGYDGFGAVNEPIRSAALAQLRQVEAWLQPRL